MVFDSLSTPEQVNYLRGVLPLNQFNDIEEEYDDFSEEMVQRLLDAGKRSVKNQMDNWPDNWSVLKDQVLAMSGSEVLDRLSYRELAYYDSAMSNSALETNLHLFELETMQADGGEQELATLDSMDERDLLDFILECDIDEIKKAFSTAGNNIWENLDYVPRMRIGELEDSNHLYADFWVKKSEETKYHPREGRDISFPNIGKGFVRVHLDEGVAEVRERGLSEAHIDTIQTTVEEMFRGRLAFTGNVINITDDDVRNFLELDEFIKATHAEHSGTAVSRWTSDDEVSQDDAYPEERPHNYKNMVFDIDNVGRVTFQLSPANNAFRIYQKKLPPEKHRKTVEFIIENLNG